MNKRKGRRILFLIISVAAFFYEFYTLVPDRIVYINGNNDILPKFVSGFDEENPQKTEELKIFGILPYKSVEVDVIPDDEVILGGESIGIDIEVDGILVLGLSDFYGENGQKLCPARDVGLKKEDVIKTVNGEKVTSASQFTLLVDQYAESEITLEYERGGQLYKTNIRAEKSAEDGQYHLGLWARDGTSGIGTLTFINPNTNSFGALGHSVNDAETGEIIKLGSGNIYYSAITDVAKGSRGTAGEMQGCFISSDIGEIKQNCPLGIYGDFYGDIKNKTSVKVAPRNEITEGEATVICCTDGNEPQEYAIEIERINSNSYDNKSMVIKVTDQQLIDKTGGIVQGMSGAPLIQNGKLVGAVTHVFVNDPTRGYAIFIENMLEEANKIK